jgi:hypothetical protein
MVLRVKCKVCCAAEMNAPVRREFGRQVEHFFLSHVSVSIVRKRVLLWLGIKGEGERRTSTSRPWI